MELAMIAGAGGRVVSKGLCQLASRLGTGCGA